MGGTGNGPIFASPHCSSPVTLAPCMAFWASITLNSTLLLSPRLGRCFPGFVVQNDGVMDKYVFFDVMLADEALSGLHIEPYHGPRALIAISFLSPIVEGLGLVSG